MNDLNPKVHTADELEYFKKLQNIHSSKNCAGTVCVIHNPTAHHMRYWPLLWRSDLGIFERKCSHGIGHPDPDQKDYCEATNQEFLMVHGCDGCCYGA